MLKRKIEILFMTAVILLWEGCSLIDEDYDSEGSVRVDVAFTFASATAGKQTRMANNATEGTDFFLKRFVPLKAGEPVNALLNGLQGPTSYHSYYYGSCMIPMGVDKCIVYGTPNTIHTNKAEYGSLVETLPYPVTTTDEVSFALESIYTETDAPGEAETLAQHLTNIANVTGWSSSTNAVLKNLYGNFINHGNNLPGSAASVKAWIGALINALEQSASALNDEATLINNIKETAQTAYNNINITTDQPGYPRTKGLPDGAAALRWTTWKANENNVETEHSGFKPQLQTTTLDNINSVSRFAYPASLYYFVESNIKTSKEEVKYNNDYTGSSSWSEVITKYGDGGRVLSTTKAVAIENPVEYAVGQLKVMVKAETVTLQDDSSPVKNISLGSNSFPLKGVIICGQRPVGYDFEPENNMDADVKFIYDSQVENVMLSTSNQDAVTALVLQSYDGEDVDIILEFENNSGQDFKCVDGTVYKNTRFYLIGKITPASGTGTNTAAQGRVFTKDHITEVHLNVKSLAKAYNVLPNLLSSNLEIGVETTPKWIVATPATVKLY